MSKEQSDLKRWLELLEPELSDGERADAIQAALDERERAEIEADAEILLHSDDVALLHEYVRDPAPQVRAVAVRYLTDRGPCSWEDLQQWSRDSDALVRQNVLSNMDSDLWAAGRLCATDKQRCVDILAEAMERYVDYAAACAIGYLRQNSDEWLELTWSAAESLLDLHNPDVTLMLTCCYFEHVIPESGWGPDDLNLRHWVEGDDPDRKMTLLKIANNDGGLEEGRMRELIEVLVSDPDPAIAFNADGILNGSIAPGALWADSDSEEVDEEEEE